MLRVSLPSVAALPAGAELCLAMQAATLAAGGGEILMSAQGNQLSKEFWFRQHGPLTQQLWLGGFTNGKTSGSNLVFTVWEILILQG